MMRFESLQDWLTWLDSSHPKTNGSGLYSVRHVAEKLNLLPVNKPTIIVAGTNGKGSCVAFCVAILNAAGYTVGTYTSPHLYRFNERICCDGKPASDEKICAAFQKIDEARGDLSLTYFEFTTLAALIIFKQTNLNALILEVGIGGRLDAVNIIDADVAIISTIDFDHMELLGETREAIGFEKAGIMRINKPVVSGDIATPNSIKNYAHEINAKLFCNGENYYYQRHETTWSWWNNDLRYNDLPIPSLIVQNAATVLQALQLAKLPVTELAIREGLKQAWLPGRFQIIPGACKIILDVAHNPASAKILATRLKEQECGGNTIAIVGMLKDKDIHGTLQPLLNCVDIWYVASLTSPRGSSAEHLASILTALGAITILQFDTITEAYVVAKKNVNKSDRIVIFGSFSTVGQIQVF